MRRLCAWCKTDLDTGEKLNDEQYKIASQNASHSICPECSEKMGVEEEKPMGLFNCQCLYPYDKELLIAALDELSSKSYLPPPHLREAAKKYKVDQARIKQLRSYIEKTPSCRLTK